MVQENPRARKQQTHSKKWLKTDISEHLKTIGVKPRTITETLKLADYQKDHFEESLFLTGPPGTGKTVYSVSVLIQTLYEWNTSPKNFNPHKKSLFVTCPELLESLKTNIKKDSYQHLVDIFKTVDLLILDDFGVEKITDWSYTTLYMILTHRYEHYLQTIFTSNFNLDEISQRLGDKRLASRIANWCKIINFSKKDFRNS